MERRVAPPAGRTTDAENMDMSKVWMEAAEAFKQICGESLQVGQIRTFDDVQKQIEGGNKASYGLDPAQQTKWEKTKGVAFTSLKYLKLLVGAAAQASAFIPLPSSAVNITSNALLMVFDIPGAVKGYNDAIDEVFNEVSSVLSQFRLYSATQQIHKLLIQQIHLVMVSFVKVCAQVVKHRQGSRLERVFKRTKSILEGDTELGGEMAAFKRLLQQQRDVEGTLTLTTVLETRRDIADVLEQSLSTGRAVQEVTLITSETRLVVGEIRQIALETQKGIEETQKGIQSLNDESNRNSDLKKIREALSVDPNVRLDTKSTQTCKSIHDKCRPGTGSWIWEHDAYLDWTGSKDEYSPHVMLLMGPASSGKTCASAQITKRLEEVGSRTFVAHYFFTPGSKRSNEKHSELHAALKYMAFQIARVDPTVRNVLGKACEGRSGNYPAAPGSIALSLDELWDALKIGSPSSTAIYYLVFDGVEHLKEGESEKLLDFAFGNRLSNESARRVRILMSGTDDNFERVTWNSKAHQIRMDEHNEEDMRKKLIQLLDEQGMLQHATPGSDQQKARGKILEKLPSNAKGSYNLFEFGLTRTFRMLSMRTALEDLIEMLDFSASSHALVIEELERSLSPVQIAELNQLLQWVVHGRTFFTIEQLDAILYLRSGKESISSLRHIIADKYGDVLKIDGEFVVGKDDVVDYIAERSENKGKPQKDEDQSTISMTITINKVDQEMCRHFFWDLTHKAIREKFKFDFDAAENSRHGKNVPISVDEFESHFAIVETSFQYLNDKPTEKTNAIGEYIVYWLPMHLQRLMDLEDDGDCYLAPNERRSIGQNLYKLFKDGQVIKRHRASFERSNWNRYDMTNLQKWLSDATVLRGVDRSWRESVRKAASPADGFLKEFTKVIVEGWLRSREWSPWFANTWVTDVMQAENKDDGAMSSDEGTTSAGPYRPRPQLGDDEQTWDRVSSWCQTFLGLQDAELDSLWFERLAEAAEDQYNGKDAAVSLYQRALERGNPSWCCYRGLAAVHFNTEKSEEAIKTLELAFNEVEKANVAPKPEKKDLMDLHRRMGEYTLEAGDVEKAMLHYDLLSKSEDPDEARQGELGYLKARLHSPDATGTLDWLRDMLPADDVDDKMTGLLRKIARDDNHEIVVSKLFTVADKDRQLLAGIVWAMERASATQVQPKNQADLSEADRFAEGDARGVLLYYRGVAAVRYGLAPEGSDPGSEAINLWNQCRTQLSDHGGDSAFMMCSRATAALSRYYFRAMLAGGHLNHVDALTKLANRDRMYEATSLLGSLYALRGDKAQARATLSSRVRQGLEILSDDMPENDTLGFSMLYETLGQYQDHHNAAIALSLRGQPDLVSETLEFEDVVDENRTPAIDLAKQLARPVIKTTLEQVPDSSQQRARIEAAIAHLDTLTGVDRSDSMVVEGGTADPAADASKPETDHTVEALRLIRTRLDDLLEAHRQGLDLSIWFCDGTTPDGVRCLKRSGFDREFYHCIYCSDSDFCKDCNVRLRSLDAPEHLSSCSPHHRWLKVPPLGSSMFVGPRSKTAPVPAGIRIADGDERVLEPYYKDGEEREMIDVKVWKEAVAQEWAITLPEIKGETSR
ncbi:hypothetical protein CAC42_2505 [Sphaceloma murrayae]|uniref:Uncharacterized protein n=1 Tax=Sphaceloma murrayae TaxID=2082308 RepID=A0A2K1QW93_9PEZI|nr:hypothetical protein CAC42_2505 [Sphaceloma murrayae]